MFLKVLAKAKNKTKLAFQAVSNCGATSGRDRITKKLQKLIELDTVGICYGGSCSSECYTRNMGEYLYYLAKIINNFQKTTCFIWH